MDKAIEVIDRNGNRVVRHNGILQDGDSMRVPVKLMDNAPPRDPRLAAAIAEANAAKRMEAFDARHHRPGYGITDAKAAQTSDQLRAQRDARMNAAWKTPAQPPIDPQDWTQTMQHRPPAPAPTRTDGTPPSHDALIEARDRRLEEAYKH